jgi:serine/threonine-protein kinase
VANCWTLRSATEDTRFVAARREQSPLAGDGGPAPAADALAGTPYRFVRKIGRGGMGEVVEAEHVALGKRVVVKLLHRSLASRPDLVDRMRLEAQALARLAHPNLVVVHDYGRTPEGRPYIVMEQLVGRTLREELRSRGRLPPAEAIELVRQTLSGLAAAHALGLVHRDVKLENLFVCDAAEGARTLKVLDFGIAKVLPAARSPGAPEPLAFPTEEGVAIGTPRFFAPEQARGQAVDARTDVYATGVVLYTLLAGRGPFDHLHALYELSQAQADEMPAPPSHHAGVPLPEDLERAVLRAIAKRPEDRFQSAAAFSGALERVAARLVAPPPTDAAVAGRAKGAAKPEGPAARAAGTLAPAAFLALVVLSAVVVATLALAVIGWATAPARPSQPALDAPPATAASPGEARMGTAR